jgi:hypothetical protein
MVTFPLDHPLRPTVEAVFDVGAFAAVPSLGGGPRNNCYRNVDREIASNGGRAVVGWQIDWWPKLFVRALYHAVVERADGTLADVTQVDPEDEAPAIAFARERALNGCVEGAVPSMVPSRYFVIADTPEVREMIAATTAQCELKRRLDRVMLDEAGFTDTGDELLAPNDMAERDFQAAHGEEMAASIQRIDRAVAACEALAARLS